VAFKDTSPFFLFSSSGSSIEKVAEQQLQTGTHVFEHAAKFLGKCPSDVYVVVQQSNVNAVDYATDRAAPHLRREIESKNIVSKTNIAEVAGVVSADSIQKYIEETCGATTVDADAFTLGENSSEGSVIIRVDFKAPAQDKVHRSIELAENDSYLHSVLAAISTSKYTVIYTTTPVSDKTDIHRISYEPEFEQPLRMELKRASDFVATTTQSNTTLPFPNAPLFEKYQFLSPGLFMGLLAGIILISILGVAVTALSSMEVSYGAFDKENGPAAQKKQQ